jgi:predicted nucleic acid-binding Zn ribbon protein
MRRMWKEKRRRRKRRFEGIFFVFIALFKVGP